MGPEIVRGRVNDLTITDPSEFAVGLILAFMISGRFLFDGSSYEKIIENIGDSILSLFLFI